MASPNPSRRPKGVLQQSIKEIQTRMGALEARVDRVEYQVEIADAYRHLRLERCPEADAVWARFENKTLHQMNSAQPCQQQLKQQSNRHWVNK